MLIKNIDLVPIDGKNEVIKNTNIYIKDNIITHIGEIREDIQVERVIDGKNKIAMPGLINAHTHIGMSLLRNFADDLPLHDWLTKKIWPTEANLRGEDVYWGSLLSMVEMIQGGTTAFCDMYFFMDEVGKGLEESGMRGVLTRGLIEDNDAKAKLKETKELFNNWNSKANGRIKVMVAPHAPYTCSPDFLIESFNLAKELNTGIHIHLSETKKEIEDSFKLYGKSPIKHVYDLGILDLHTIAAHCVHVDDEDIEIIKEKNVFPVNNPGSNFKLASGFAPVAQMLNKGVSVALGTDGSSSNNNLNMFEEINLAAIINKAVNLNAISVPAISALEMATVNGAKALGWNEEIGSIEVGKKADIVLIDIDKPHLYPHHNIISSLAYSVQASDVDTVLVDGKIIMEKREVKTLDVEKIKFMAEKHAKDLITR
ncbi:amidohydrolase [Tissierella praeacuta]|uniref:5-methylthioadenosine/S-adenosylhomocysteine deaminase n=1 Tax=Tissierella praeacuta DSM 18095 TaxID=1123404 RepID=A0A1M4V5N6_9FIRM|nr:amidohydrolase [Tissierella praeacuta]TCU74088.1 5-methylthioadenosine/S-adenosylhomocysteine deaminase [Tissierella praeacuta]SHE64255.1 5-methylthioadenosine/S-adenosylhomocysteine deaminase [Tissierella praeacuta DSM 18095]SUP02922.1 5-methylthioadenosine/S-adenosylhomocysteine deaminase [Tissierella praeacuta]